MTKDQALKQVKDLKRQVSLLENQVEVHQVIEEDIKRKFVRTKQNVSRELKGLEEQVNKY